MQCQSAGATGNRQLFADKLIQRDVPHSRFNRNIIGAKAAEFDVARAAGDGKFASRDGQRAADIACAAFDAEPIQLPGGQIDRHNAPGKGAGVQTAQPIHAQKTQIEDGFATQHAPAAQHNLSLLVFRKSEISFRKAFGIHACGFGRRSLGKANFANANIQRQRGERIGIQWKADADSLFRNQAVVNPRAPEAADRRQHHAQAGQTRRKNEQNPDKFLHTAAPFTAFFRLPEEKIFLNSRPIQ